MEKLDKVNIIITSEDNPSGFSTLNKLDVKVLHFPLIKTVPYSEIQYFDIKKIDYIIFTSKKGVKYFFENQECKNYDYMNSSNQITIYQNQISQSMPECENINRDGEEVEN